MKTILLVEDDLPLSEACRQILTRAGYAVTTAGDGDAGVATFAQARFDLLIVDMFLPGGRDGYEVIDACRQLDPTVPILGVSGGGGFAEPNQLLRGARELGAIVTISKPFSADDLLGVVDQILGPDESVSKYRGLIERFRKLREK